MREMKNEGTIHTKTDCVASLCLISGRDALMQLG